MKKLYKAEIVYKIQLKKGWRKKKIEVFEIYHSLDRIFVAETPHSAQMQVLKLEKYRGEKFPYDLRWEENYYGLDGKDYKIIDISAEVKVVGGVSLDALVKYMDYEDFINYLREMLTK